MKKEHIIERQGKSFALYAGLLDEAHKQGLVGITTALLQFPSEENKWTTICQATITMERDGKQNVFQGIGDASPGNVGKMVAGATIRMAETRSKARALRDACNLDISAVDDLPDESPDESIRHASNGTRRLTTDDVRAALAAAVQTTDRVAGDLYAECRYALNLGDGFDITKATQEELATMSQWYVAMSEEQKRAVPA